MTREEAIKVLSSYDVNGVWADIDGKPYNAEEQAEAFDMAIEALQAEPVKHGKWVKREIKGIINPLTGENRTYTGCSCCGEPIPTDSILDIIPEEEVNFCFGCGAKMKGQEE